MLRRDCEIYSEIRFLEPPSSHPGNILMSLLPVHLELYTVRLTRPARDTENPIEPSVIRYPSWARDVFTTRSN